MLPGTPMWAMLERRFELDPSRFSFFHPNVAMMLNHAGNHVRHPHEIHGWAGRMRGPHEPSTPSCPIEPPHLNPQTVPEPDSLAMGAVCVAVWLAAVVVAGRRDTRK
jgi:hypothetical protein